jgi:hypothetical protein
VHLDLIDVGASFAGTVEKQQQRPLLLQIVIGRKIKEVVERDGNLRVRRAGC